MLLSKEFSKFPFQTTQSSDDFGHHHDVDFRVEVLIDGIESNLVREGHGDELLPLF